MTAETTWTVVVAAGAGQRFGGRKQFALLCSRPLVEWSVDAAKEVSEGIVLVAPCDVAGPRQASFGADRIVEGGATRAASVRAGLAALPPGVEIVVVHDAARPLASPELFRTVVGAVACGGDGAVPALAVADTIKRVGPSGGEVVETLPRERLVRVQTPQAFRAGMLRAAHSAFEEATDDATLVERIGGRVVVVSGEEENLKITSAGDLALAEWYLSRCLAEKGPSGAAERAARRSPL